MNQTTTASSALDYYENLRNNQNIHYRVNDNSNIIEVEVPSPLSENNNSATTKYRLCHIAAFIALSTGTDYRSNSEDEAAAILLAVYHFNNGISTVVPQLDGISSRCNIRLTASIYDTAYSPLLSSRILSKKILGNQPHSLHHPHPIGLIGAYRSAVSKPLATLGASTKKRLMQISHASTSTEMDNKDQYPFFGRTVSSSEGDAFAVVEYLHKMFNVTHCGALFVREAWGIAYQQAFQRAAEKVGMRVVTVSIEFANLTREEVRVAMRKLKETRFSYFYGLFYEIHYDMVMKEAYAAGIAGDENFWLMSDGIDYKYFIENARYPQGSVLAKVTHGIGFFHSTGGVPNTPNREGYDKFLREWPQLNDPFIRDYIMNHDDDLRDLDIPSSTQNFSKVPNQYTFFAYDATIAYGLTACVSRKETLFTTPQLYNSFLSIEFDGASGPIKINKANGRRQFNTLMYVIENIVANEPDENDDVTYHIERTAFYAQAEGQTETTWMRIPGSKLFNYTDGTLTPPAVLPPLNDERNMIGKPALVIGYALAGIVIVTSVLSTFWIWKRRHVNIVRMSNPYFYYLTCCGTIFMACAIVPSSLQEPVPRRWLDVACMTTWWLCSFGFLFIFLALISKSWWFKSNTNRRVPMQAREILLPTMITLSIYTVILLAWTIIAPLKYERVYLDSRDVFGRSTESYGTCEPTNELTGVIFVVVLVFSNVAMVLFANVQAYRFRSERYVTDYSESRYIGFALAFILQSWLMGIPLMIAVWTFPQTKFLILSIIIFVTCQAILLLVFIPNEMFIRKRQSSSSTTKSEVITARPCNGVQANR